MDSMWSFEQADERAHSVSVPASFPTTTIAFCLVIMAYAYDARRMR